MPDSQLFIGLMSGTSLDGIDAALLKTDETGLSIVATCFHPFSGKLRQELLELCSSGPDEISRLGQVDRALGYCFADAAIKLLAESGHRAGQVTAIGCHGQTVRHCPPDSSTGREQAFTLQIGDPNTIAQQTGITTIADFRRRDIAAGGQGAPLVPAFHRAAFGSKTGDRIIVNIGGMANISVLRTDGSVTGFDTGPGNVLMDFWIAKHKSEKFDENGNWAARGEVNPALLQQLLDTPYFALPPPKSTGRELFNPPWLETLLSGFHEPPGPIDVQRTLLELTATSIANAIRELNLGGPHVFLCGGGAHNHVLTSRLEALLHPRTVASTATLGIDPDWVEAAAFAWLAKQTLEGGPGNIPAVTGAESPVVLGAIYRV
jgi:anhydro-N-acetylmuramic acid kinase